MVPKLEPRCCIEPGLSCLIRAIATTGVMCHKIESSTRRAILVLVDYAFSHPSISALTSVGATGVIRYLSYQNPTTLPKIITPAEFSALSSAGFTVTLNWEYDARDLVNPGFNATDAAQEAQRQANALPYSDFRALYWSADFDVQASD